MLRELADAVAAPRRGRRRYGPSCSRERAGVLRRGRRRRAGGARSVRRHRRRHGTAADRQRGRPAAAPRAQAGAREPQRPRGRRRRRARAGLRPPPRLGERLHGHGVPPAGAPPRPRDELVRAPAGRDARRRSSCSGRRRMLPAARCLELGLVNRVVPSRTGRTRRRRGPPGWRRCRRSRRGWPSARSTRRESSDARRSAGHGGRAISQECFRSDDAAEGLASFGAKRVPVFHGR